MGSPASFTVLAVLALGPVLHAQGGRLDASMARVLFQSAQAEASANAVRRSRSKTYLDWTPSPKQADATLAHLEALMLGSAHADARVSAVQLFDGACRAAASQATAPCVTGDSVIAGRMSGETYRGSFQVQLVATLQRFGERTRDSAARNAVVDLLIGTMRLVRVDVPGCNNPSCEYLSAQRATEALGAVHNALMPRRADAQVTALMIRIERTLRGSASSETVPSLKSKMERTLAELASLSPVP